MWRTKVRAHPVHTFFSGTPPENPVAAENWGPYGENIFFCHKESFSLRHPVWVAEFIVEASISIRACSCFLFLDLSSSSESALLKKETIDPLDLDGPFRCELETCLEILPVSNLDVFLGMPNH